MSIKGWKVSFAGALIGEETETHTKWLTQKTLKELLEKHEASLTKDVNSNTTHLLKGRLDDESTWDKSKKAVAVLEQNEKRREKAEKAAEAAQTATAAGGDEGTTPPAKKKQKTGGEEGSATKKQKKPSVLLGPIEVLDFGVFLDEHGLREEWVAAMDTADFTKDKVEIEGRKEAVLRKHTSKKRKSTDSDASDKTDGDDSDSKTDGGDDSGHKSEGGDEQDAAEADEPAEQS